MFSQMFSDVRFTLRLMRNSPGFFATLLTIIVAGIGATTAMFSIVYSLLLKPLPYKQPEQLTTVWATQPLVNPSPVSLPDFLDWKAQATHFSHMTAVSYSAFSLSSEGNRPEFLAGGLVSGDFFPMFGVKALHGRLLVPEDNRVGQPRVAVISAAVFHQTFASDPKVVGKTIMLNSQPHTVVGVAPEGFRFSGPLSDRADVWVPIAVSLVNYTKESTDTRGSHFLHVLGRRKPGVSLGMAQAQLNEITNKISIAYPDTNTNVGARVEALHDSLVGSSRSSIWILFGAMGMVFVIVCANVANLLLTRAQGRRSEMAARAALGATSMRLAAQVVTETMVVFLVGAAGGAVLSRWLVGIFAKHIVDGRGARTIDISVDATALVFCVVVSLVCGLVFGLVPAMAVARTEAQTVLKESASRAGVSRSQKAVRSALVIAQVALAFTLLTGSGLALRSFAKLVATPTGFEPANLATGGVVLPARKYDDLSKTITFYDNVLEKLASLPGVESVAGNSSLPMSNSSSSGSFKIEGKVPWKAGERPILERNVITPGYFRTMRIQVLRGREFTEQDRREGRNVMILSQAAAARFFPGQDPIGQRIDWGDIGDEDKPIWREVIGIVADVRRRGLNKPVAMDSYVPLAQHGSQWMAFVIRSPRAPSILQELPGVVQQVDSEQAVANRKLMADRVADTIGNQRYLAVLLGSFSLAALLLATLGIFGLVTYSTNQRTREIGIRMALGSSPESALWLVMKEGLRLLAMGTALGLLGALLLGRSLFHWIPGVSAFDPAVSLGLLVLLSATGMVACLIPAWRAVRIPPASALRYESLKQFSKFKWLWW
jgi:putative ABC transport system permease protein